MNFQKSQGDDQNNLKHEPVPYIGIQSLDFYDNNTAQYQSISLEPQQTQVPGMLPNFNFFPNYPMAQQPFNGMPTFMPFQRQNIPQAYEDVADLFSDMHQRFNN